jgi:hypothetical protein
LTVGLIGYAIGRQKAIEKEASYEKMFEKLKANRLIYAEKKEHLNSSEST